MKRPSCTISAVLLILLSAQPTWAGHNEHYGCKKKFGITFNYFNDAEAHSAALGYYGGVYINPCLSYHLGFPGCPTSSCSSTANLGHADAYSWSCGCSCGGNYHRYFFAISGPGDRAEVIDQPPAGVDSVGVSTVSVSDADVTLDVYASALARQNVTAQDTVAFFVYRDTTQARLDTQHTGATAIAGGMAILHMPEGTVSYPAVPGGNRFVPTDALAARRFPAVTRSETSTQFLIHQQFTIADADTDVVIGAWGGGGGNTGVPMTTPSVTTFLALALLSTGAGALVLRRRRYTVA